MNMIKLPDINSCCGCELCESICPFNAITIKKKNGFTYPKINYDKCQRCKKCINACITLSDNKSISAKAIRCYGAYIDNISDLKKSTSGGLAYAIANKIVDEGGIVYSVAYSKDFMSAEYIRCANINDIKKLQSTKYFFSRKMQCYKKMNLDLNNGLTVCMIGLPCEIAAAKRYIGNRENFISCELICHGPTSEKAHSDFITLLSKDASSVPSNINYRKKVINWENSRVFVQFNNGTEKTLKLGETFFFPAFEHNLRKACYNCRFKSNNSAADITLGDLWGYDKNSTFYNEQGMSSVIIRTEIGQKLIDTLSGIKIKEITYESILNRNPRLETSEKDTILSNIYRISYSLLGLKYAGMIIKFLKRIINKIIYIQKKRNK